MTKVLVAALATILMWAPAPRPASPWNPTPPPPTPAPSPAPAAMVDNVTRAGVNEVPHGGNILYAAGEFYWYGETYACGFKFEVASTPWCGFQVYWSSDLVHWSGPKMLFDPASWQTTCQGFGCFRPKVVYNAATGLYVLWFNTSKDYRVMTSTSPAGPFSNPTTPNLQDAALTDYQGRPATGDGDEGLFVEGTDAYIAYTRGGVLVIEQLTSDFRGGASNPLRVVNYPEIAPWYGIEAPSMFASNGTYYMTMSLPRCPYCTAATGLERAPSPLGPWSYAGQISSDSCKGQPDGVVTLPDGALLYQSDQWLQPPDWPYTNETAALQHWEILTFKGSTLNPPNCATSFALPSPLTVPLIGIP